MSASAASERMVHREPSLLVAAPLEQREVGHPEKLELRRRSAGSPSSHHQAQLAEQLGDRFGWPPASEQQVVARSRRLPAMPRAGVASDSALTELVGGSPGRTQIKPAEADLLRLVDQRVDLAAGVLVAAGTRTRGSTPPSATICLKTRNSDSLKTSDTSAISSPQRRSGLSDPYFAIASAYGMRRNGDRDTSRPTP